jgi:predicted RND superfamily exporter protein
VTAPSPSEHPVVRLRWVILALLVAVSAWLAPGVAQLRHDDDVLAFLPPEHPDVVTFRAIAERFGMLEVALIGLEPPDGQDLLEPDRVEQMRAVGHRIETVEGVRLVLSLPDFPQAKVVGQTLVVQRLVPAEMTTGETPATAQQIRKHVLADENAVGNFVSSDGEAAAVLAFLATTTGEGRAEARAETLRGIRAAVDEGWAGPAYYGGAPFIETTASTASREDIERLSPIVIIVLVVVSAVLLRSVTAAVLNLLMTGLGVVLIVGAHGRFGEPFTIVSSTTPVMMVALGGAFGMHILAGYQRQAGTPKERATATLRELSRPVLLSGLTTAIAFFALRVMPQIPLQRFGIVAGLGMLLLLVLALVVLPALLSVLPSRLLPTRDNLQLPLRRIPPLWVVGALAVAGVVFGSQLRSDPDTTHVFDEDSEPRAASSFFDRHFGGSQFLQIAVEADLSDPIVLREIRSLADEVRRIEGVAEVRSLVEPVSIVSEGFGGRRGIPSDAGQTRRVVSNLADHPAMKQLMTPEADGAIVHVKLATAEAPALIRTTEAVRAIVARYDRAAIGVGAPTPGSALDQARRREVFARTAAQVGVEVDPDAVSARLQGELPRDVALPLAVQLRDRMLGSDEVIEPLPPEQRAAVDPAQLLELSGEPLRKYLAAQLPELVEEDAEGPKYLAQFVASHLPEALERERLGQACRAFGLPAPKPPAESETDPFAEDEEPAQPAAPVATTPEPCAPVIESLKELSDPAWGIPPGVDAQVVSSSPWHVAFTGQPVIGQAFGESVTRSLGTSTLVSWVALALVLLAFGHIRALIPATWTLAVTAGAISLLGHPISIGTSMVSCIALGAGVDFAIHLAVRAREIGGDHPGRDAAESLGSVVLMAGIQLTLAFSVLLASQMPPLRQFGVGLGIGLIVAAAGAVWLTPRLFARRVG